MLFINNLQEIKRFYKIEIIWSRLLKFVNLPPRKYIKLLLKRF